MALFGGHAGCKFSSHQAVFVEHNRTWGFQGKKREAPGIDSKAQRNFPDMAKELVEHFVYNSLVKRAVEKMFLDVGKDAFIHQELAMMKRSLSASVLSSIMCPTLVIHAAQDKNFSLLEHQELVNQIQNAKLALVEDSGHMSPMEVPQAITALLRFWLTYFLGFGLASIALQNSSLNWKWAGHSELLIGKNFNLI